MSKWTGEFSSLTENWLLEPKAKAKRQKDQNKWQQTDIFFKADYAREENWFAVFYYHPNQSTPHSSQSV